MPLPFKEKDTLSELSSLSNYVELHKYTERKRKELNRQEENYHENF